MKNVRIAICLIFGVIFTGLSSTALADKSSYYQKKCESPRHDDVYPEYCYRKEYYQKFKCSDVKNKIDRSELYKPDPKYFKVSREQSIRDKKFVLLRARLLKVVKYCRM